MMTSGIYKRSRVARWMLSPTLALMLVCPAPLVFGAIEVRIKDIARIAGLDRVPMVGYGIVLGLNGSGDKDLDLTKQTMANLLEVFNIKIAVDDIKSKNVAAVIVTATAEPFYKAGDHLDVQVSSIGDAQSLEGGILMMTPLLDPEGRVSALAQGSLTVGGFSAGIGGAGGDTARKNYTTVGIVPGGATLKYSQEVDFYKDEYLTLVLRHSDFTTASRTADAINEQYDGIAMARDANTVAVRIPNEVLDVGQVAQFVAGLEKLSLTPDVPARVVVNERTGTIVMGGDVHIAEAVIAHGNLTVNIGSRLSVDMPAPFTDASPVVTEKVTTRADEQAARIMLVPDTVTVRDLADVLNQMGATPRDLISILEALQRLGALQMELVAM